MAFEPGHRFSVGRASKPSRAKQAREVERLLEDPTLDAKQRVQLHGQLERLTRTKKKRHKKEPVERKAPMYADPIEQQHAYCLDLMEPEKRVFWLNVFRAKHQGEPGVPEPEPVHNSFTEEMDRRDEERRIRYAAFEARRDAELRAQHAAWAAKRTTAGAVS